MEFYEAFIEGTSSQPNHQSLFPRASYPSPHGYMIPRRSYATLLPNSSKSTRTEYSPDVVSPFSLISPVGNQNGSVKDNEVFSEDKLCVVGASNCSVNSSGKENIKGGHLKGCSIERSPEISYINPGSHIWSPDKVVCQEEISEVNTEYFGAKDMVLLPPLNLSVGQSECTLESSMYNGDGSRLVQSSEKVNILETPSIMNDGEFQVNLGWEFDVVSFAARPDVGNLPLLVIGNYIIVNMSLDILLNLNMHRVNNWLRCVEDSYLNNPYHNHLHGADVMCSIYHWFTSGLFLQNMSPIDLLVTLMAAGAHDVGHDAVNNVYHIMTRSRLGTRYNDMSPLENYHASLAFRIMYISNNNWINSMQLEVQCYVRSLMIELILATDANSHQKHKANIMGLLNCVEIPKSVKDSSIVLRVLNIEGMDEIEAKQKDKQQSRISNEPCEKVMILKAGLHIADIANPAKPNNICVY